MKIVSKKYSTFYSVLACAALFAANPLSAQNGAQAASAQEETSEQTAAPNEYVLTMLTQSTLSAFNHANLTGDYSVLLKLSSTGFQQLNTEQSLADAFAGFRTDNIDLTPIAVYPITWTSAPELQSGGMRLNGKFATRPQEVLFDLGYVMENGRWRIAALSVSLSAPVNGGQP